MKEGAKVPVLESLRECFARGGGGPDVPNVDWDRALDSAGAAGEEDVKGEDMRVDFGRGVELATGDVGSPRVNMLRRWAIVCALDAIFTRHLCSAQGFCQGGFFFFRAWVEGRDLGKSCLAQDSNTVGGK